MSNARTRIFQRLTAVERPVVDLSARESLSRFAWDKEERIRRFTERMQAVRAEVHVSDREHWLDKLAEICQAKGLNHLLLSPNTEWGQAISQNATRFPTLKHYDRPIEAWKHELFHEVDAGLTSTLGGIAETGTLMLWPNGDEPRLLSLVPPIHIAILETDKLFSTFAEAVQQQAWAEQGMPTNAVLISGPSRSADIAQVLAYGVHGPKELVVVLV
ncbi:LutC/YkgG family protein [Thiothrix eikelboomii]|uniref:L-lactate dehydrogenase complex protein LldG n=1 Tax=Thiothrix eikelboomii TaxID=92487 RepID=A0A1T4XDW2_9GAMM|nr:lactate utilization protein [Thiothrix eikelboomii]SKA87706.1 L-lactate dehydrogenase complex protein LldG [Thiothrix eikelboomii]